jgi:hypothetical protein
VRARNFSPLQRLLNSDPQINRGRLFKGIAIAFSIVGLFALAASALSDWWFLHSNGISSRSDDWGSFGAYVNGIAGTAIALTTLIALALTFAVKAGEMERSRHAVLRQVFDSTFFQLLHRFSKIVSSLEAREYPGSGRSG